MRDGLALLARRSVADDRGSYVEPAPAQLGDRLEEQGQPLAVEQATDEEHLRAGPSRPLGGRDVDRGSTPHRTTWMCGQRSLAVRA